MLLDHERSSGLGMDALVTVCSWTTNVVMAWAWMHWLPCALGPRTLLWFRHGCTGYCVLLDHERYSGLGMDELVTLGPRPLLCSGHGCIGCRMLLDHERYYGLSMDALVIGCRSTRLSGISSSFNGSS